MIKAIIYTSNTGTTAQYAKLLGEKTGLPVCSLSESSVPKDSEIIYPGWVMASSIKGYKKAARQYRVRVVCGVCMGATGSQLAEVRKQNAVPVCTPPYLLCRAAVSCLNSICRGICPTVASATTPASTATRKTAAAMTLLNRLFPQWSSRS